MGRWMCGLWRDITGAADVWDILGYSSSERVRARRDIGDLKMCCWLWDILLEAESFVNWEIVRVKISGLGRDTDSCRCLTAQWTFSYQKSA